MISKELLDILLCPETLTPLSLAGEPLVQRLNQAVAEGRLTNRAGELIKQPLDGGLVRADGLVVYGVFDGIPVLLMDEAIELAQLGEPPPHE